LSTLVLCTVLGLGVAPGYADIIVQKVDGYVIIGTTDECAAVQDVSRIEILYAGPPEPDVFGNVAVFPPFTSYETDGESHLHILADNPVHLPEPPFFIPTGRFSTVLELGEPGYPSPFTFVEYDASGSYCIGIVYVGSYPVPTVSVWGLVVLALLLLTVGTAVFGRRRRAHTAAGPEGA
jgi:hypothetical protein